MNVGGCEKRGLVEESRWVDFGMAAVRAWPIVAIPMILAILAVFGRHVDTL
jgi:hypothetical protein